MTRRLAAALEAARPFPSLLAGAVVALVALVADAPPAKAVALGLSMTLLQASAGVLEGPLTVRLVAGVATVGGIVFALAGGPSLVALALAVLGVAAWGAPRTRGTTLSWLPAAITVPLLPVYGWLGAAGTLPAVFVVLVPAAANAGAALAIAGAVNDVRRDEAAGIGSIAVSLGARRAAWIVLGLQLVVGALAVGTAAVLSAPAGWLAAVVLGAATPAVGAGLGVAGATRDAGTLRELGWEVQAVGTGLLSVAWLGALSATGGGPGL